VGGHRVDQLPPVRRVGDVAGQRGGPGWGSGVQGGAVAGIEDEGPALVVQGSGERAAEAALGAGDDGEGHVLYP
jgi:hypothetical protein